MQQMIFIADLIASSSWWWA